MEDPSYAYLHCDLLDNFDQNHFEVKLPHIEMHEQHL
jgi:hypothetical protein